MPFPIVEEDMAAASHSVHHQVEIAVAIDIRETCAGNIQFRTAHACRRGNIFKSPVAKVAVEVAVAFKAGKEQIAPAITIDVSGSHARAIEQDLIGNVPLLGKVIGEQEADRAVVHKREAWFTGGVERNVRETKALRFLPIEGETIAAHQQGHAQKEPGKWMLAFHRMRWVYHCEFE